MFAATMNKLPYAQQLVIWRCRREKVMALLAQGKSMSQIGAAIGCTKQRVHQIVTKAKANGRA